MVIKRKVRKTLIFVFVILALAMVGLGAAELFLPKYEVVTTSVLRADGQARISYDVYLKDNPVFEERKLSEGGYYLKPFTDYVDIKCYLSVSSDEPIEITTVNSIDLVLVSQLGSDDDVQVIWEKKEEYAAPVTDYSSDGVIEVERGAKLYFEEYDRLVNELIDDYELLTDYHIKVLFNTNITVKSGDEEKEETLNTELIIPFNDTIFSFEGENELSTEIIIEDEVNERRSANMNLLILFAAIFVVLIIIIMLFLLKTKELAKEDAHSLKLSKIFKQYGNRLAGLSEAMAYQSSVMISIDKMEDMVKIADEIGQTIFYYLVEDESERKVEFYIFDEGRIYYLVMYGEL
jgi:hypothetical protein